MNRRIVITSMDRTGVMFYPAFFARSCAAGILVALTLAVASPARLTAQQPYYAELLQTVEQFQQRLDANDAQLEQLQQRDARRQAWEASVVERLPTIDSPWSGVSVHDDEGAVTEDGEYLPECPDDTYCPGCPSYCADCLEELGWNKANGWRIVPFDEVRGETIYSTAPQTGDAVIAFLNPNILGVEEDQFTVHGKQSQINFALSGPNCGCWETGGTIAINFMGAQAAGTYFVATLQSLNPKTDQAIESVGGWGEIYYRVSPCVTMHVGYGVDDPRNADLGFIDPINGVGQISYNDVGWWNVIWNVTDYFDIEFEVSHRRTRYLDPTAANEGTLFHFASRLKF